VWASVRRAGDAPAGTRELVFDVTDADGVARAASHVDELDALVANAGIAVAAPLEVLPPDELTRQLDVNVVGQLRCVQAFLPALRRRRGRVVIIGSIAGRSALPFLGAYAMSKFALEAMTDALRIELAPEGMHVAIVEPGTIATPIWTKPRGSPPSSSSGTARGSRSSAPRRRRGRRRASRRTRSRRRSSTHSRPTGRGRATSSAPTRSAAPASRYSPTARATGSCSGSCSGREARSGVGAGLAATGCAALEFAHGIQGQLARRAR
jgi:NAD(P)-dependent dehydrogenase (short-subunit alcohol dehydrogenase family)